ncbi:MAG: hypothetical protein J1E81_00510 [Eubacterium sp.]|nr:hypothetical protein [Eubacterium sp.]
MSDEKIIFADMLNHYSLKVNEISDLLSNMVTYLNKSVVIIRESWQSEVADKFLLQISGIQQYINTANSSLDDLMKLFNTMKSNELDAQIEEMRAEIDASDNS